MISLTTGVMGGAIRPFHLSGTSRCASQKDTKRQKWMFSSFSGPFGRRIARFPRPWLRAIRTSPWWWIFFCLNLKHAISAMPTPVANLRQGCRCRVSTWPPGIAWHSCKTLQAVPSTALIKTFMPSKRKASG